MINEENNPKTLGDFTTAFFSWKKNENMWISADPVDEKVRWMIRPAIRSNGDWEVSYVRDRMVTPVDIDPIGDPIYLGMRAVSFRLKQIIDFGLTSTYVIPMDLANRAKAFLDDMITRTYIDQIKEEQKTEEQISSCHA